MRHFSFLLIILMALPLWSGCAPRVGHGDYGSSSAGAAQRVEYGTIVSLRPVYIEDDSEWKPTAGTVLGGVAGGVLGSLIGGGSGRTIATVGGAALGAAAGYAGTKAMTGQQGLELTVQLDDGSVIAVAQGDDPNFFEGQRVRILSGSGRSRIVPLQ